MVQFFSDKSRSCEEKLLDTRSTLESLEELGWDDALLAEYQVTACFMVHNAIVAYMYQNGCLPNDLRELVGIYFMQWPDNPQNDWQPIEILGTGAAFSAGDFVFQECPVFYQSLDTSDNTLSLIPLSYELSIFGPYSGHYQGLAGKVTNTDWATVPAGSVAIAGLMTESAEETVSKLREQQEAAQAIEDEAGAEESGMEECNEE